MVDIQSQRIDRFGEFSSIDSTPVFFRRKLIHGTDIISIYSTPIFSGGIIKKNPVSPLFEVYECQCLLLISSP